VVYIILLLVILFAKGNSIRLRLLVYRLTIDKNILTARYSIMPFYSFSPENK